ncbi:MAG: outer-membrane lipoprotein carrier protein LolA [Pseudomonadota bacterium]
MLSTFIALAAGFIGSLDSEDQARAMSQAPAHLVPAPAPVSSLDDAVQSPEVRPAVAEPDLPSAEARLVRVQDAARQPETEAAPAPAVPEAGEDAPDMKPAEMAASEGPAADVPVGDPSAPLPRPDPSVLSLTERRAVLKSASEAMSRVETAQGRFVQVDAAGQFSEGDFFLQRPGRMRFDYDAPVPILIAADGVTVALRDDELETVDRVPLGATPLGLLLDDQLDFETEADVIRVQRAQGRVAITVVDPTDEADGELTLIFNAGSFDLLAWQVLDANGGITTVELRDVETGISLNQRLFIIEEFEDEDDDRRR